MDETLKKDTFGKIAIGYIVIGAVLIVAGIFHEYPAAIIVLLGLTLLAWMLGDLALELL